MYQIISLMPGSGKTHLYRKNDQYFDFADLLLSVQKLHILFVDIHGSSSSPLAQQR
jgi:hypothetical protein